MEKQLKPKISIIKIINKIGFFRLTLLPIGIVILITAYQNQILGMGIVGLIIMAFGAVNKCLLMGNCEIPEKD